MVSLTLVMALTAISCGEKKSDPVPGTEPEQPDPTPTDTIPQTPPTPPETKKTTCQGTCPIGCGQG